MRMLVAVCLCLLNACCVSIPNQYERTQPATLLLERAGVSCSGVATGPHSVATASHCTEAFGLSGSLNINGKASEYSVVADDGNDHVILRVSQRQRHTAHLRIRTLHAGDTLYLWGNPAELESVLRVGRVAGFDPKSRLCLDNLKKAVCSVIYFDGSITHGDSGGGYFNAVGELVAIESGGYTVSQYAFSIPFFYPITFTPAQLALARQ